MPSSSTYLKRDQVYSQLKRGIVSGEIKGGARLNERELSEQLGVGRSTVRESLLRLVNDGFVASTPGVGSFVKVHSLEEAGRQFYIRELLEGAAAKFAAERIGKKDAADLLCMVEKMESAFARGEAVELTDLDMTLHHRVADLCGDDSLRAMIYNCLGLRMMISGTPMMGLRALQEHKELLETLRQGNADRAEALMRTHVANGAKIFLEQMAQEP